MTNATIADIFNQGFAEYANRFGAQPLDAMKAVTAITTCRTETQGGHRYQCDQCGNQITLYNSCRNRNCPQCQTLARLCWVHARTQELLPVGYFHAVFTIPDLLNAFAIRNRAEFYRLMFRAVKETLLTLAQDPKRLGATIGCTMVLHTWGQTLIEHPHLHCIIPGGGLATSQRWKPCKNKFLFPIPVLQKMYRGKLMDFFVKAVSEGEIKLHGQLQEYADPAVFRALIDQLYCKTWVVYVKAPFASPQAVVKYLGQYTHRVAISNQRIVSFENGMVTFSYKDYADDYKRKLMTVTAVEFIRRFLMHIVPRGFVRIRHYGFLANRNRATKLATCCRFFGKKPPKSRKGTSRKAIDILKELKGFDPTRCRECKTGTMRIVAGFGRVRFVMIN